MMNLAFGRWQVIRELKTGGMGTVFLVWNEAEFGSRKFALKSIRKDLANDHLVSRFQREREVMDQLSHPDIVRIVDRGQSDTGESYFVMEYVEGQSIVEYCVEESLSLDQRVRLFHRACLAVAYLHSKGFVHRDLKPSNIFVDSDGDLKLLDFGIAKALTDVTKSTIAGLQPFTPAYASPEQLLGSPAKLASDVYSLGNIFYRLLTGRGPFPYPTEMKFEDFRRLVVGGNPPAPSKALMEGAPPDEPVTLERAFARGLDSIALKSLMLMPDKRYRTAVEFAEDLDLYLNGEKPLAAQGAIGS